VSTAVVGVNDSLLSRVANGLTYAARSPSTPGRLVQHYGQSYARTLLRHSGLFPPGLRIGEDTVLNKLAERLAQPVWAPEVQTAHRDPQTLAEMVADARARGRRRVGFGAFRKAAEAGAGPASVEESLAARLAGSRRLVEGRADTTPAERRALLATQWLVAVADASGSLEAMQSLAKANRLSSGLADGSPASDAQDGPGPPAAALAAAEAAWALDPQDPAKARRLGRLRQATGDLAGAEAAFRAAMACDPADAGAAALLADVVQARSGPIAALHQAERAALAAPTSARLWAAAADRALLAGSTTWAVALGQIALSLAVGSPAAHAALARLHGAAGDPLAAAFRAQSSRRLQPASAPAAQRDGG
jgi:tetratricopeptide (TPR) repeat protein